LNKTAPNTVSGNHVAQLPAEGGAAPQSRNLRLLETLLERRAPSLKGVMPAPSTSPGQPTSPDVRVVGTPEEPAKRGWIQNLKARHWAIGAGFLALVALPTAVSSGYMAFVAADQYHSFSSFSVRAIDSAQPSDILGMFSQASSGSTISDSYVLLDFILSERMVQAVDEAFGLDAIFARQGMDFFYGIKADMPIEDRLSYWRRMVTVNFDHTSGIMDLEVKAFTPELSQKVGAFVIAQSERLINDLSLTARNEVLKVSQSEVLTAEQRLAQTRSALRNYRDTSQEADPIEGAKLAAQLIGSLEQQLVQLRTELATALTQMGEDTPRVRVMRSQIASLENQLGRERQRFGAGTAGKGGRNAATSDVAGRIAQYEELQTQNEFAERAYTSALAALEKARVDSNAKQRYLAVFINPTLSEMAQYPHRILNPILVLLAGLLAWGVSVMIYYNIRDRH
jgi:capsular polysaccharide transport system permease protein